MLTRSLRSELSRRRSGGGGHLPIAARGPSEILCGNPGSCCRAGSVPWTAQIRSTSSHRSRHARELPFRKFSRPRGTLRPPRPQSLRGQAWTIRAINAAPTQNRERCGAASSVKRGCSVGGATGGIMRCAAGCAAPATAWCVGRCWEGVALGALTLCFRCMVRHVCRTGAPLASDSVGSPAPQFPLPLSPAPHSPLSLLLSLFLLSLLPPPLLLDSEQRRHYTRAAESVKSLTSRAAGTKAAPGRQSYGGLLHNPPRKNSLRMHMAQVSPANAAHLLHKAMQYLMAIKLTRRARAERSAGSAGCAYVTYAAPGSGSAFS